MNITIGIPRAFFWYRYGEAWRTFFSSLGCDVIVSAPTTAATLDAGTRDADSECCLPSKIFLGHVRSLIGRCDCVLVPCACPKRGGNLMCARFWGLPDVVRHTYNNVRILDFTVCEGNEHAQYCEYQRAGRLLGGHNAREIRDAYAAAIAAQNAHDAEVFSSQQSQSNAPVSKKILVAGHSYVLHDPLIGGTVISAIRENGGVPLFSDRFDRADSHSRSKDISPRLYWTANRESVGAIASQRNNVDGAVILTAFPCAPDALSGEMAARSVRGLPIARFTLDGLSGDAGIATRVESFMDILSSRKGA